MSDPTREAAIGEVRDEIIREYRKEYGSYPSEDEIQMEMETWCEGGY